MCTYIYMYMDVYIELCTHMHLSLSLSLSLSGLNFMLYIHWPQCQTASLVEGVSRKGCPPG